MFYAELLNDGSMLRAFTAMSCAIKEKQFRDVYIFWGLHFSTLTKPDRKSDERLFAALLHAYVMWLRRARTAMEADVKRNGVEYVDVPQGKGLDLLQSGPVQGYDVMLTGANDYEPTANSDIAIITAGFPRKPGMSRDDLLMANFEVVKTATAQVAKYSPNCIIIVVTNPLDAMAQAAYWVSKFSKNRIVGMAGVLDSARFRTFIAAELKVSVENVTGVVMGGHGDTMVPLVRLSSVAGIPLTELMDQATIDRIVDRTRNGGAEIVKYLKTGSAYYAPSAAAVEMAESILRDKKKVLPCAAYLEGEYGINGLFVGVPVKLGALGIEQIYQIKLTEAEQAHLNKSASAVQELVDVMKSKV